MTLWLQWHFCLGLGVTVGRDICIANCKLQTLVWQFQCPLSLYIYYTVNCGQWSLCAPALEWGYRGKMPLKLWYHHLAHMGRSAVELWHHRVSSRGKYEIIQSERVSKLDKWEGLNDQHLRAGNSTTEGFETANANQGLDQGYISPLFLHSTAPAILSSASILMKANNDSRRKPFLLHWQ